MAIFMHVDGIPGDVTESGHVEWINCETLSWGISRDIGGMKPGTEKDRESSTPSVDDVRITTAMDKSAPLLAKAATSTTGKLVKIHFMQSGQSTPECYMEYKLSDALVSDCDVSGAEDGMPTVSVSFNFSKIEMKYTMFDEKNSPAGNITASYDLKTGVPG